MNIDMDDSELTAVLKKEIDNLKTRNTLLYRKKKNLLRSNLRLKKQLKNHIIYITSLEKPQFIPQKFKSNLKPIQEEDEELWDNLDDEWDCI